MKIAFIPTEAIAAMAVWAALGFAQSPSALHEGFVDVPGAKIFYEDSGGAGVPVIFLHAYTGNADVWEYQIPAFTRVGYRFIAYDRRGYGRTVAHANGPASTGADDLLALIDHLRIDKFHLVGTAGGGFIAVDFAISYPQRLRSFTLLCSTAGVQDKDYVDASRRMRPGGFEKMPNSFLELSPSYRFANPDGVARWSEFETKNRAPEAVRGPAQPNRNRITLAMVEGIRIPTLVIAGDADLYAPPVLMRKIADRIQGAQFTALPEAGHSVWWEAPDEFNRTVLTFLAKH
jgi:pimeloyl-ACP methyl ester carboxylesterase